VTAAPGADGGPVPGAAAVRGAAVDLDDLVAHLADHVPEIVTVVDGSGTFLWVGAGSEPLLGRPAATLVGTRWSHLVHPDDLAVGMERFVGLMASGRADVEPVSYRLSHADGRWIPIDLVAAPVALGDGSPAVVVTGRRANDAGCRAEVADELSRRTAMVFDDAAIGMAEVGLDGRVLRVNEALSVLLATPSDELVGRPFSDVVHPDERTPSSPLTASHLDGRRLRLVPPGVAGRDVQDAVRHVRVVASVAHDRDGAELYHLLQVVDITGAVRAKEALAASEQRLRTTLDLAEEGIVALDPSLVVTYVNRHLADMLVCQPEDLVGRSASDLFHLVDTGSSGLDLGDESTWPADGVARFEATLHATDGSERWVMIAANSQALAHSERHRSVVAMVTDITALKSAEAEPRHRSNNDPSTGLASRSSLDERRAPSGGQDAVGRAVIYLDLDGFKEINDTYGHQLGDRMLTAVANRLKSAVRGGDVLVRLGGDEFLVWLETDDERAAVRLADRLLYNLVDPFVVDGRTLTIGASAGVAVGQPGDDVDDLMRRADRALYEAKHAGGRRFVVHGPDAATATPSPGRA
jgi:diguanylate cyclase (GGDEF)-like protein/PAS domain S-box-containing protein